MSHTLPLCLFSSLICIVLLRRLEVHPAVQMVWATMARQMPVCLLTPALSITPVALSTLPSAGLQSLQGKAG